MYEKSVVVMQLFFCSQAKMLEEMDEEFGISNLVEEEFKPKQKVKYLIIPSCCSSTCATIEHEYHILHHLMWQR